MSLNRLLFSSCLLLVLTSALFSHGPAADSWSLDASSSTPTLATSLTIGDKLESDCEDPNPHVPCRPAGVPVAARLALLAPDSPAAAGAIPNADSIRAPPLV